MQAFIVQPEMRIISIFFAIFAAYAPFSFGADICRSSANFCWHESFDDWSNIPGMGSSVWELHTDRAAGAGFSTENGGILLSADAGRVVLELVEFGSSPVESAKEWSIRARLSIKSSREGGDLWAGVGSLGVAEGAAGRGPQKVGISARWLNDRGEYFAVHGTTTVIELDDVMFVQLDLFRREVTLSVWEDSPESVQVVVAGGYRSPLAESRPFLYAEGSNVRARIEDVWISDVPIPIVPEPSGLVLTGLALAASRLLYRKRAAFLRISPSDDHG